MPISRGASFAAGPLLLMLAALLVAGHDVINSDVADSDQESVVVVGNSSVNGTIVVGYLMDQLGPPYRIGAISMAIDSAKARGLLPGYNFRYVFQVIFTKVRLRQRRLKVNDSSNIINSAAGWLSGL